MYACECVVAYDGGLGPRVVHRQLHGVCVCVCVRVAAYDGRLGPLIVLCFDTPFLPFPTRPPLTAHRPPCVCLRMIFSFCPNRAS